MDESNQVLLTVDQVEQWEQESAELARKIADDQARLDDLRQKLKFAEYFRPKKRTFFGPRADAPQPIAMPTTPAVPPEVAVGDGSGTGDLTAAIERIANGSARPVAKKALKAVLAREGFAADRLANYFYTAIHRLKGKDRITVLKDGSVWKAPGVLEANSN